MRIRFFVEIDLSNEVLLKQFGAKLPELTPQIPGSMGNALGAQIQQMPGVTEVKVITIPVAMSKDVVL